LKSFPSEFEAGLPLPAQWFWWPRQTTPGQTRNDVSLIGMVRAKYFAVADRYSSVDFHLVIQRNSPCDLKWYYIIFLTNPKTY
jgi:hypothetical protein